MRQYVCLYDVCKMLVTVNIPGCYYADVNAAINTFAYQMFKRKLMLIFPNMNMLMWMRQNTRLHTIDKIQVNLNIPQYKCADVNAEIRMFT